MTYGKDELMWDLIFAQEARFCAAEEPSNIVMPGFGFTASPSIGGRRNQLIIYRRNDPPLRWTWTPYALVVRLHSYVVANNHLPASFASPTITTLPCSKSRLPSSP